MRSVDFHFHVPDKLAYLCRLSRKVVRSGALLTIAGPQSLLESVSERLWSLSATDFLAHCTASDTNPMQAYSPIFLTHSALEHAPHREVILNLHDTVLPGVELFERVIEVVSEHDGVDRHAARAKWRHYTHLNVPIVRHDLSAKVM